MYNRYLVELEDGTVGRVEFAKVGKPVAVLFEKKKGSYVERRGRIKKILKDKERTH